MSQTLFGTDGVRGETNTFPMDAATILAIGAAVGRHFRRDGRNGHRVVIGKDTRLSSYMVENALTAGLTSTGMNALLLGPVPTPAVGYLTRSMRADLGVMISASHNGYRDNGIKFFGPDGFKLSDADEREIERLVAEGVSPAKPDNIGRARRIDDGLFRYMDRVKSGLGKDRSLEGLRVVIDCANGAGYRAAPEVLWELGAEVIKIGVDPNGRNINADCGSTDTRAAAEAVRMYRADLGICLDGDADRLIVLDENGDVADGDQIMALLATRWKKTGQLKGDTLVATVMSNLGLERHIEALGIRLERTRVGDRHVVEAMRRGGWNLGGEQSGHIVMTDHATTGDGLAAALQVLDAMVAENARASEILRVFDPVPQRLENLRYAAGSNPLEQDGVAKAVSDAKAKLGAKGRVLVRKSGTEPLIRVMVEADSSDDRDAAIDSIIEAIASFSDARAGLQH